MFKSLFMYCLKCHLRCISFLLLVAGFASAQPPPAAKSSNGAAKIVQEQSLARLPPTELFSSADGRFTIALPKAIAGFAALSPSQLGFNATGSVYRWRLREGFVLVHFHDFLDPLFSLITEQNFTDYFAGVRDSTLTSLQAKLISGNPMMLGQNRGYNFAFRLANGEKGLARAYYVDKRAYLLMAILSDAPNAETLLAKAFDSFALISITDSEKDAERRVREATPDPLPQQPVTKKEKSDAQDENLNGPVKTVTYESEDLSGTWSIQGRKMSWTQEFDPLGNFTKRISYDSKAKPYEVTVFGYLEGRRVSKSKSINYDDDPPSMAPGANPASVPRKDARYEYKYEYKYDTQGRQVEEQLIYNTGLRGMRYVHQYADSSVEELVYDSEGKLNQKFVSKLDAKGNEVERISVDVLKIRGSDEVYSITYDSFDERGNWTKRTTSKFVTENGKKVLKPWYVYYRTIKFH